MAIKLEDFIPSGTNIFGARTPTYLEGLITPDQLKKAQQQSLFQGLLGTAVGYLAQPKNQNYGSAVPYLAKGYLQGMESAQTPFSNLEKDVLMKEKFGEIKRTREKEDKLKELSNQLYTDTGIDMNVLKKINSIDSQYAANVLQTEKIGKELGQANVKFFDKIGLVDMDKYNETKDLQSSVISSYPVAPNTEVIKYKEGSKEITAIRDKNTGIITPFSEGAAFKPDSSASQPSTKSNYEATAAWIQSTPYADIAGQIAPKVFDDAKLIQKQNPNLSFEEARDQAFQNIINSPAVSEGFISGYNYNPKENQNAKEGKPVFVQSKEDVEKLPKGTKYITPNGTINIKQ